MAPLFRAVTVGLLALVCLCTWGAKPLKSQQPCPMLGIGIVDTLKRAQCLAARHVEVTVFTQGGHTFTCLVRQLDESQDAVIVAGPSQQATIVWSVRLSQIVAVKLPGAVPNVTPTGPEQNFTPRSTEPSFEAPPRRQGPVQPTPTPAEPPTTKARTPVGTRTAGAARLP
jgi:hypothetical protein